MSDTRPLFFSAFVMNTASHVLHGLWRAPEARNHEFNKLRHWTSLASSVEKAGYDLLFFADVFGLQARVIPDPVTGTPLVVPMGGRRA